MSHKIKQPDGTYLTWILDTGGKQFEATEANTDEELIEALRQVPDHSQGYCVVSWGPNQVEVPGSAISVQETVKRLQTQLYGQARKQKSEMGSIIGNYNRADTILSHIFDGGLIVLAEPAIATLNVMEDELAEVQTAIKAMKQTMRIAGYIGVLRNK